MEFSDLALAKLLQAAPELSPYILNFSELSEEPGIEDDTKVGVFILRAGLGIVYVPVVGKGDTLFPIDSLFFEEENMFKPLTKDVISSILSSVSPTAGKVKKIPGTVDANPSLQNLINPPRTGKFVYASVSRLPEFLAILPDSLKKFTFEKIAAEQSVYNTLDKLFGLKAIFSVLNEQGNHSGAAGTGPRINKVEQVSVLTTPQEITQAGDDNLAKDFLANGFAVQGTPEFSRVAVAYQPFNRIGTYLTVSPATDPGEDRCIAMKSGGSKDAYLPKYHAENKASHAEDLVSIFVDGNYARGTLISTGSPGQKEDILKFLFNARPPKLLRDLEQGEYFLVFSNSGEALGPYRTRSVTRTAHGVDVRVSTSSDTHVVSGCVNYHQEISRIGSTLFVPHNAIVFVLGEDITYDVERNATQAAQKKDLIAAQLLGAELDIRYDGVEFSLGGKTVGGVPQAVKALVEEEHLSPEVAHSFLKEASEVKYLKVFLSKKASSSTDVAPAEIPQIGTPAAPVGQMGINGSFMPAVQDAAGLGDGQIMEATIISQLLQVPDLFEYIEEFLPELEMTVDKLGRTLFLSRIKISQLSERMDSDSVFALIAQVKNVYRQLGDCVQKLRVTASTVKGFVSGSGLA